MMKMKFKPLSTASDIRAGREDKEAEDEFERKLKALHDRDWDKVTEIIKGMPDQMSTAALIMLITRMISDYSVVGHAHEIFLKASIVLSRMIADHPELLEDADDDEEGSPEEEELEIDKKH